MSSPLSPRHDSAIVPVRGAADLEHALKKLKKACTSAAIFVELKKRSFYVPPSAARRLKAAKARARDAKAARRRAAAGPPWRDDDRDER